MAAESLLPGLAEWRRVIDYRIQQIKRMRNIDVYLDSRLTAKDIYTFGASQVIIATGSNWRRDGVARWHLAPVDGFDRSPVFTPDDIMAGADLKSPVVLYDDDHYYMGGVLAEKLQLAGLQVSLVTSAGLVSQWCENTVEQERVQGRLLNLGVNILTGKVVNRFDGDMAEIVCAYTGHSFNQPAVYLVTVTARIPHDDLYRELNSNPETLADNGILQVHRIGDCRAPGIIAAAVYSGHKLARELDDPEAGYHSFIRERCTI